MSSFSPTGKLAESIFNERYTAYEGETWEEAAFRVAWHVAGAEESRDLRNLWAGAFEEQIKNGLLMPGGRIWYGSGRPQGQLLNCFVVPSEDSIEGWAKTVGDVMVITAKGGGVGVNLSSVRERGAVIKGTKGYSTGAVSLAEMIDMNGNVISGGGGRRLALMLDLDITHPDMPEFLDAKLRKGKLENANISLVLNFDPQEFVRKVRNNESIELEFDGRRTGGTVNARKLFQRIVRNAWKNGEPGILNGWLANQQNNIAYYKPLVSTNPCGEIWLEEYGCCCLGALVLPRFVRDGEFDWDAFRHAVRVGVRFLDNVLTVNRYPLDIIRRNCEDVRRLGLGVMGVHNMLLELGMKYSSPEAIAFLDKLFNDMKVTAYEASVDLAGEKGAFPKFNPAMADSGFCETLPANLRQSIREKGIRNCALLTVAPTGTTSLVQGVSSGIEPLYAPVHIRTWWEEQRDGSKKFKRELVIDEMFEKYPELCEGALDISPKAHFEVQKVVQKHIDNAVSKTINLPKDITKKELMEVWLDYLPYLKGTTLFREGSRVAYDDQGNPYTPLTPVPRDQIEQAKRVYGFVIEDDLETQSMMDCVGGVCSIEDHHKAAPMTIGLDIDNQKEAA